MLASHRSISIKPTFWVSGIILLFILQEMSYNNYLDADAAWNCVSEFKNPTCVIVKHTNPCGVASRQDILEAYRLAVKADPVSAFGGIVAFNTTIDEVRNWEYICFRVKSNQLSLIFQLLPLLFCYNFKWTTWLHEIIDVTFLIVTTGCGHQIETL